MCICFPSLWLRASRMEQVPPQLTLPQGHGVHVSRLRRTSRSFSSPEPGKQIWRMHRVSKERAQRAAGNRALSTSCMGQCGLSIAEIMPWMFGSVRIFHYRTAHPSANANPICRTVIMRHDHSLHQPQSCLAFFLLHRPFFTMLAHFFLGSLSTQTPARGIFPPRAVKGWMDSQTSIRERLRATGNPCPWR